MTPDQREMAINLATLQRDFVRAAALAAERDAPDPLPAAGRRLRAAIDRHTRLVADLADLRPEAPRAAAVRAELAAVRTERDAAVQQTRTLLGVRGLRRRGLL